MQVASFEGEAAMAVGFAANHGDCAAVGAARFYQQREDGYVVDCGALVALPESGARAVAPERLAAGVRDALRQASWGGGERDIAQAIV